MWYLSESKIHGIGLYTREYISPGQIIDMAINNYKVITYFGSKINHSWNPNTELYEKNNIYYIVATKPIYPFTEITTNYTNTPNFIKKPNPNWK